MHAPFQRRYAARLHPAILPERDPTLERDAISCLASIGAALALCAVTGFGGYALRAWQEHRTVVAAERLAIRATEFIRAAEQASEPLPDETPAQPSIY